MEKEGSFFEKILPEPPPNGGNGKKTVPQPPEKKGGEKTSGAFSAPEFLERLRCPAARTGILRGFF